MACCVAATIGLAAASTPAVGQPAAAAPRVDYATARFERRLPAAPATGEITLDGLLDEESWRLAPVARNFLQSNPREGAPATFDTEVRVLYDDNALYVGVFAEDEAGQITVSDLRKDYDTSASDGVRIILDTFHDERNGYELAVNPSGAKWDAQTINEGRETNENWDGVWDVATRIGETGWYAEIRIPFRSLKFAQARDPQAWGVNFERKIRRLNEDSYWSPVPRIYDIERVSLAGTLEGLTGLRSGTNVQVKPYVLGSSNTVRALGSNRDFDVGLDVKYAVTSGLTWDFTVNTDFSQVEADEQQINLSRFSLFFPEKREFFLENSGIFAFGAGHRGSAGGGTAPRQNAAPPMRLFFSRRIGLSDDGTAVPILAGTRLTGRQGPYSLGVLSIQQREQDAVPTTNFTALRLRRDILANSDIGAVLLNKDEAGSHYNRVIGIDANFRFGDPFTVNAYIAKSFSPDNTFAQDDSPEGNAFTSRLAAEWNTRTWWINGRYDSIGERFNDEMGFVPRRGVNNWNSYIGRRFRPVALSGWVREILPHAHIDVFARQDGGGLESRYLDYHLPFFLQDGSAFDIGVNTNVEEIASSFLINRSKGIRVGQGRYSFNEGFFRWIPNWAARFGVNADLRAGGFYDGTRRSYSVGPTVRLNENVNAWVNLRIDDVDISAGEFVTKLVTGQFNYSFNTRMFLNALLQFNTDTREWSSNVRFNIIHRPLSDFFFVYNERRDDRTGDLVDRALVAKMTYLVQF